MWGNNDALYRQLSVLTGRTTGVLDDLLWEYLKTFKPTTTYTQLMDLLDDVATDLGITKDALLDSIVAGQGFDTQIQAMFLSGELGAFYSPSDLNTVFQDAPGTTPVTAVTQPIGLLLDKSRALSLGAELRSTISVGVVGTPPSPGTYDTGTGVGTIYRGASFTDMNYLILSSAVAGDVYYISVTNNGPSQISLRTNGTSVVGKDVSPFTSYAGYITCSGSGIALVLNGNTTNTTLTINSIKKVAGYSAQQTTTTSRPLLATGGALYQVDYDGVDDLLTTVFPDLGTNVTIVRSVPGVGASILTAQTIGAGARNDSTDNCGLLIINRALTAQETITVTRWANSWAGV